MGLSELKRIAYALTTIALDVEKGGGFTGKNLNTLNQAIKDLKVLDGQSTEASAEFEYVDGGQVKALIKQLRERECDPTAADSADVLEKLWRNVKKVDKTLIAKNG